MQMKHQAVCFFCKSKPNKNMCDRHKHKTMKGSHGNPIKMQMKHEALHLI
jgi:hypothetical protein